MFRTIRFLPAVVWMGLIFYGSSQPKIGDSGSYWVSLIFFKTLHIIEYGTLFSFWKLALHNVSYGTSLSLIISTLYGISDEIHQTFTPTREGTVRDVLIDFLGVLIFWRFLFVKVERLTRKSVFLRSIFFSSE